MPQSQENKLSFYLSTLCTLEMIEKFSLSGINILQNNVIKFYFPWRQLRSITNKALLN